MHNKTPERHWPKVQTKKAWSHKRFKHLSSVPIPDHSIGMIETTLKGRWGRESKMEEARLWVTFTYPPLSEQKKCFPIEQWFADSYDTGVDAGIERENRENLQEL